MANTAKRLQKRWRRSSYFVGIGIDGIAIGIGIVFIETAFFFRCSEDV
jgi:hypothetical protein